MSNARGRAEAVAPDSGLPELPWSAPQIELWLLQRYPFLFIDRVLEIKPRKYIRAYKNISRNEACFQGHFPGHPIFPAVLVVEAINQAVTILGMSSLAREAHNVEDAVYLVGMDNFRFRKQVEPGDRLDIEAHIQSFRHGLSRVKTAAHVDGELVCSGEILGMFEDKMPR